MDKNQMYTGETMSSIIAKIDSGFHKKINILKKKWLRDINNLRLVKHENVQLHHLFDKLIAEGRVTLSELQNNVDSRIVAKSKLDIK